MAKRAWSGAVAWMRALVRSPGVLFLPLAIALFALANVGAAHVARARIEAGHFRFGKSSIALADEFLDHVSRAPSPKIVFLGDSVVQGEHEPDDATLPVRVETRLRNADGRQWTVFNLGLTAANNSDKFLLIERLLGRAGPKPDLVVVEDNLKFYSDAFPIQTARYPMLATNEMWKRRGEYYATTLGLTSPERRTLWGAPDALADRLASHIFLWRNRDAAAARLGGDHPARRGLTAWNKLKRVATARTDADRIPSPASFLADPANLDAKTGINMRALGEIATLCVEREVHVLFYLTPVDVFRGLGTGALDLKTLSSFSRGAKDATRMDAAHLHMLFTAIRREQFRDMDHTTSEGMDALADVLTQRILEARP